MSNSQLRDPAIKLFGRNIPLPDSNSSAIHHQSSDEMIEAKKAKDDDSLSGSDGKANRYEENGRENVEVGADSDKCEKEKALKKPDRLIPCPRCNSSETKFCYFNNYNVNQPRHFCRNCHRYWTAGGTIRNVPVGAGRRRNAKPSLSPSSQPRQSPTTTKNNGDNSGDGPPGSEDSPLLCESMESKLNLREPPKRIEPGSDAGNGDRCDEPSSSSSSSVGTQANGENPSQCYPVPQWAYPWSPAWNVVMVGPNNGYSSPVMTVPGFFPPNAAFPLVPGSYWGYVPGLEAGKWVPPALGTLGNSGSPKLGKHSRDVSSKMDEGEENCLWVPKTLRIDDPNEAAKSSIWSTLGIEADRKEGFARSGIFKPFKRKTDGDPCETESDQVLQSNPAALSRSYSFQESS